MPKTVNEEQWDDPIVTGAFEIFRSCEKLLVQRGAQYGGAKVNDYMPFRELSYMQMVHLKYLRLMSGINLGLPSEDLRDSALDLINYTAFFAAWLARVEKGEEKMEEFMNCVAMADASA